MPVVPKDWARAINEVFRRVPSWPIYALGLAWMAWWFWLGLTNQLGAEPINVLLREYGEVTLVLLIVGLIVTPLRALTGISLLKFRRAIGLTAFGFAVAHVLVWGLLDLQSLSRIGEELVKRPYIMLGFAGFVLLVPLAITSNNISVRKLGAGRWRSLHRLTYPAVLLGGLHYLWLVKGYPIEPFVYLGAIGGLLLLRLRWARRGQGALAKA